MISADNTAGKKNSSGIPLIEMAVENGKGIAIKDSSGHYSYHDLLHLSRVVATNLLQGNTDLGEKRVAFLVPSGFDYVITQWGIWLAGGIAVPLCITHPKPELEYVITNCNAEILVTHADYTDRLEAIAKEKNIALLQVESLKSGGDSDLQPVNPERRAMIIYTSGTTSKPKGVVTTHHNIAAQISSLVESWEWTHDDFILHVLPLHHVHGIINVLSCALWVGACCDMLPKFEAETVWQKFLNNQYTLFMAVPTIYVKLGRFWDEAPTEQQITMTAACTAMRLMVSGSAALPVSVLEKWKVISGHTFLERYGMTEIGMALSNPLHGERRPGYVGFPLPGVTLRLVEESNQEITGEEIAGEIQIKGDTVFKEYWNNPQATDETFQDGWFCTGDIAVREKGYYRLLGRNSVDIIKSGGYKISALEIEEVLREHPLIEECSVVGVADEEWGEKVSVALILKSAATLSLQDLQQWAKERLAGYKIPRAMIILDQLPRNVMGKVTKPDIKKLFE